MAFPQIAASTPSGALSGTSQSIPLPTHAVGDRLLVLYALDGGASNFSSATAGWTLLGTRTDPQNAINLLVFEKIAASTAETLTITLAATRAARSIALKVTDSDTAAAATLTMADSAGSPNTTPNPPSHTASWGAADTLWIAAMAQDASAAITVSAYPTNYSNNQTDNTGGSSSTPRVTLASRQLNSATEDPGAFTISASEQWATATIAIKPVSGGGGVSGSISVTGSGAIAAITGSVGSGGVSGSIAVTGESAIVAITGSAAVANDIRLQFSVQKQRGGYDQATGWKYTVFANETRTAIAVSGTLNTDATGTGVIDIYDSPNWVVGDWVPVLMTRYDSGLPAADRVIFTIFGFVQATAAP